MAAKWEYACLSSCVIPLACEFKHIAGPELSVSVEACKEEVFVHNYGPSFRKFYFVAEDGPLRFYKHCRDKTDIMCFRMIVTKLIAINVAKAAAKIAVVARSALTGDILVSSEFEADAKVTDVCDAVRAVLKDRDPMGISSNSILKIIKQNKILQMYSKLVNLLEPADKKIMKGGKAAAKQMAAKGQLKINQFAIKK